MQTQSFVTPLSHSLVASISPPHPVWTGTSCGHCSSAGIAARRLLGEAARGPVRAAVQGDGMRKVGAAAWGEAARTVPGRDYFGLD